LPSSPSSPEKSSARFSVPWLKLPPPPPPVRRLPPPPPVRRAGGGFFGSEILTSSLLPATASTPSTLSSFGFAIRSNKK
jgi:hypothetical protein